MDAREWFKLLLELADETDGVRIDLWAEHTHAGRFKGIGVEAYSFCGELGGLATFKTIEDFIGCIIHYLINPDSHNYLIKLMGVDGNKLSDDFDFTAHGAEAIMEISRHYFVKITHSKCN